jgi:hypothetical protein
MAAATTLVPGYLTAADWTTFNNKAPLASPTFTGTITIPTISAHTLGGTVSGGGNQINNVVIGASTPLAGNFTTLNANGRLGIGTTSPSASLHVSNISGNTSNGGGDATGMSMIESTSIVNDLTANTSYIAKNYYGTSQFMQWQNFGLRIGSRITTNAGAGNVYFTYGNDSVGMTLNASGNLGIGADTAVERLTVTNGSIRTSSDNSCIVNGNDANLGFVKKAGFAGQLTVSSASNFIISRLNQTTITAATVVTGTPTELLRIDTAGRVTMPYQVAFFAGGGAGTTYSAGGYINMGPAITSFVGSTRNSGYNGSTGVYTAPVAGLYQFYCQLYCQSNGISATWWKNGIQLAYSDAALMAFTTGGASTIVNGSILLELAVGDTFGMQVRAGYAGFTVYGGHSSFYGYLIG